MRVALAIALAAMMLASCAATSRAPRSASIAGPHDADAGHRDELERESRREVDEEIDGMVDEQVDEQVNGQVDGIDGDHERGDGAIDVPIGQRTWRGSASPGPRVAEVVAAAYRAAGLDGALRGFARRARLGGLVPAVSVRTGRDASWHDEDPDVGRGTTLEVRATWRLDRLVFDGRELQVVALEAARRRERRRLATHVIRTYYVWKRSGSRAAEAEAELEALTDGWFSETRQRGASESRTVGGPPLPRENLPGGPPGSKLP